MGRAQPTGLTVVSPALLNFLAGTSAAIFAGLLAAIPAGREHGVAAVTLALAALPWLVVAMVLAFAANRVETAIRRFDRMLTPYLTDQDVDRLHHNLERKVRGQGRLLAGAAAIAALGLVSLTAAYW